MPFIRVRSASPGDPLHEFDVAQAEAVKHADLYEVLDAEPSPTPRAALHVPGVVKKPRPAKKRAGKKPGEDSTAPAGADSEEEA